MEIVLFTRQERMPYTEYIKERPLCEGKMEISA